MATITFYGGGGPYAIANLLNSGIAYFGNGFGTSVSVGEYADQAYISDGAGTQDGGRINYTKYFNASSGEINGGSAVHVKAIPNYLANLNIRFEHGSAVKTQNAKLYIFDRTDKNLDPSGVTTQVYESRHVTVDQDIADGSGLDTWTYVHGSAVVLDLLDSPATSGTSPAGASSTDTRHDWYVNISPSPDSIGSKELFGARVEIEYL